MYERLRFADNGEPQAITCWTVESTGITEAVTMSKFRYYSMLEQKEEALER